MGGLLQVAVKAGMGLHATGTTFGVEMGSICYTKSSHPKKKVQIW